MGSSVVVQASNPELCVRTEEGGEDGGNEIPRPIGTVHNAADFSGGGTEVEVVDDAPTEKRPRKDETTTDSKKKPSRSTAGPHLVEEFISRDHQSSPVVVCAADATKVSKLWTRQVATYIKLRESFAKAWLLSPESYLIAAVMLRRTQPSCTWTEADELQSTPTNIYLQLRNDANGFKVSAVRKDQDSDVRIDHDDLYKHRVRCFTGAPSCVQ